MVKFTPPLYPASPLAARLRTGLVLLGMGGPDGPDAVAPFLTNLFADPAILPLPAVVSRPLGRIIVQRRQAEVRARYARLGHGGGSPQLDWTRRQAARLADLLRQRGLDIVPVVAMRYWHPLTAAALAELRRDGVQQILAVPTYPQYGAPTTGSSLAELQKVLRAEGPREAPLHVVRQWPLLAGYLDALAGAAATHLARWHREGADPRLCAVVHTAHSLPVRFPAGGDPYVRQTRATVRAAHARLQGLLGGEQSAWFARLHTGGVSPCLAFQSKVGPMRWVGPTTRAACLEIGRAGVRRLLVVPVSFACEHIETLDELDRELAEEVRAAGVERFERTPALNLHDGWLRSLADLIVARAFRLTSSLAPAEGKP